MTPLAFLLALLGSTFAQSCDPSIYVEKIHAWNKVGISMRADLIMILCIHPDT